MAKQREYVLDFLEDCAKRTQTGGKVEFEYRLLCSGEIYNARVLTSDWRKSDATRILMDSSFTLLMCSRPFDEFPQEIALRFFAPMVQKKSGNHSTMFYPDEEIAKDLAALLTLHFRRLITVSGKVRESHPKRHENELEIFQDWPISFITSHKRVHWKPKPALVSWGFKGIESVTNYNPPPLGVDHVRLEHLLFNLPSLPLAECIVFSARLYALALQEIEEDADFAYQLLFAAVEATANKALSDYSPTDDEKLATKKPVADLALQFGLSKDQANQLAMEACKGIPWASRKFVKFILDNTTDHLWSDDDLFKCLPHFLPVKADYETVLSNLYATRSKLVHGGRPFPPSSGIGGGPSIPTKALIDYDFTSKPFPPVVWFERVVNHALSEFIKRSLPSAASNESPNGAKDV